MQDVYAHSHAQIARTCTNRAHLRVERIELLRPADGDRPDLLVPTDLDAGVVGVMVCRRIRDVAELRAQKAPQEI